MSFTSFTFAFFLILLVIIYYLIPGKYQWIVLLLANVVFYIAAGPKYLLYLLFTILSGWYLAKRIGAVSERYKKQLAENEGTYSSQEKKAIRAQSAKERKRYLLIALLSNFGVLAVIKYYNFAADSIMAIWEGISLPTFSIILPLGISFYIFQSMGYVIDVYRERYTPEKNPARYALFISFFPQMVQGPISRFEDLAGQLNQNHRFDIIQFRMGLERFIWGFFKKLVIADRLAIVTENIFVSSPSYQGAVVAIGAITYTIRIYADFSGGMDIALGAAQMLGIRLTENFERPCFAKDIPDFWRRWHITLGAWFRDYVFYPLSLSKAFNQLGKKTRKLWGNYFGKLFPTLLAQSIVFLLVGIWHGAAWKYVAFGLYHGTFVIGHLLLEEPLAKFYQRFNIRTKCFSFSLLQIVITFIIVAIGRVLSYAPTLGDALRMISSMFVDFRIADLDGGVFWNLGLGGKEWFIILFATILLFIVDWLQEKGIRIRETLAKQNLYFKYLVYLGVIFAIILFGVYGIGYDSAAFLYRGF